MRIRIPIFTVLTIAFCLFCNSMNAQWYTNPNVNNAICTASNTQSYPTIVNDGAGGAIITWQDSRFGSNDIYAQRINAAGAVQWTGDGVALCTAAHAQNWPTIVSDGAGGAIVTWQDYRSNTNYDIYVQRINAAGAVQWIADGVAISTAANDQQIPTIVSDSAGGAIITWVDRRNGTSHIYTQRINAAGVWQWTDQGVAICTAAFGQLPPNIVSDGAGGAIITWSDYRNSALDPGALDIYAQRINAAGADEYFLKDNLPDIRHQLERLS